MQPLAIQTLDELSALLTEHKIDVSKYGCGTAKMLSQLLKELREGESSLGVIGKSLVRSVHVLMIAVLRADGKILMEANQQFHQTSDREAYSRQRNCLLAEKLFPGEDITVAVRRAISEELGIELSIEISAEQGDLIKSASTTVEEKYSQSYPGLLCSYNTTKVEVLAESLGHEIPDGYTFTEHFENGAPRVTATWRWM